MTMCNFCASDLFVFEYKAKPLDNDETRHRLSAQLFHEQCTDCQNADFVDPRVCDFCKHLRLRHLFCCVASTQQLSNYIYIKLGRFEDIEGRSECPFCRLIITNVLPYGYMTGITPPSQFQGKILMFAINDESIHIRIYDADRNYTNRCHVYHNGLSQTERGRRKVELRPKEEPRSGAITHGRPGATGEIPLIGKRVNWDLIAQWTGDCRSNHERCTGAAFGTLPVSFRVIDIRRRCLVQAGPDSRFAALSYVWGKDPDPTKLYTKKANIDILKTDGCFRASDMPATVEDAMEACRRLHMDYLWVDRFCIIQDDANDKNEQISGMAMIYSQAEFVIISTDGDSDSGIPGVSHDRRQTQIHEQISGIKFMNDVADSSEITGGGSIWSTRGWTYQEALLARRKIFLTDAQAFFECGEMILGEDESSQSAMYSSLSLNPQPWNYLVDTFYSHLLCYRKKKLTNASDIYNAVDGIATALYREPDSLWYGLPRREFDKGLLWCKTFGDISEAINSPNNGTSPSWSWSSSTFTLISLLDNCNQRSVEYCDTLVEWVYLEAGPTCRLKSIETFSGKPLSHFHPGKVRCDCTTATGENSYLYEQAQYRLAYLAIAWIQGCINKPCPFDSLEKTTFWALKSLVASRWTCHHEFWFDAFQSSDGIEDKTALPNWAAKELNHAGDIKPCTIVSLIQSAFFRLQGTIVRQNTSYIYDLCIVDEEGQPAGLLVVRDRGMESELEQELLAGSRFEFIALSIGTIKEAVQPDGKTVLGNGEDTFDRDSEFCVGAPSQEWYKHLTFQDSVGDYLFPIPIVNVMLIRRRDNVARRVSVGWIYLTSWTKAHPEFRPVLLE